ncbi:hypothetical protein [Halobacillus naozhouensis]|uniref:Uncharacterized protein n=1 Tax=Halobacillus naozhouensis TaxID=554880 RepID=A0ABY8IY18_9BACI|nr:hypothetical protein [Halobacillus naozhouensis]WFT74194.1 hypothetical protein P9989_17790 [Halobacillus naozhouensis]
MIPNRMETMMEATFKVIKIKFTEDNISGRKTNSNWPYFIMSTGTIKFV